MLRKFGIAIALSAVAVALLLMSGVIERSQVSLLFLSHVVIGLGISFLQNYPVGQKKDWQFKSGPAAREGR